MGLLTTRDPLSVDTPDFELLHHGEVCQTQEPTTSEGWPEHRRDRVLLDDGSGYSRWPQTMSV